MDFITSTVSIFACSIFTCCAIYGTIVEHPSREDSGMENSIILFKESYTRASKLQPLMALTTFLSSLVLGWIRSDIRWIFVAFLIISVVPYTFFFMFPLNHKIMDDKLDRKSKDNQKLLDRWIFLHMYRLSASIISYATILYLR